MVDGWHRYQVAALAGVECPAVDVSGWPAGEVEAAVQSANRHRRHSSRKELLEAMARQRLTGEAAPPQTVEQEALFAGVTKRRYQQVLQATREELGLAPPNSGGRPPAAAVQEDAEALDLDRMLELQADTIEAQQRAAAGLAAQVRAAAVQQLAECRQLWPGGVDTAAPPGGRGQSPGGDAAGPGPRLPICPGPAGPAGRRPTLLRPGLTRGDCPLCPFELRVSPVEGRQPNGVGGPPPDPGRRPGDRPAFRVSEIDHDAVLPLFDRYTQTAVLFCANLSTGRHY